MVRRRRGGGEQAGGARALHSRRAAGGCTLRRLLLHRRGQVVGGVRRCGAQPREGAGVDGRRANTRGWKQGTVHACVPGWRRRRRRRRCTHHTTLSSTPRHATPRHATPRLGPPAQRPGAQHAAARGGGGGGDMAPTHLCGRSGLGGRVRRGRPASRQAGWLAGCRQTGGAAPPPQKMAALRPLPKKWRRPLAVGKGSAGGRGGREAPGRLFNSLLCVVALLLVAAGRPAGPAAQQPAACAHGRGRGGKVRGQGRVARWRP